MGILDILNQYADPANVAPGNVAGHFDQVAGQSSLQEIGNSVAAAFRSDATPPFGQMIGDLFSKSDPSQRAGILNQIVQSVGAGGLASVAGGALASVLGPAAANGTTPQITPEQASQVSPADAGALAAHAEKQNGSIIDMAAAFYAQHPTLVKSLGASALAIALGHLHGSNPS
jgi:hypothetical protein